MHFSEVVEKRAQRHLRFLREKKPGTLLWLRCNRTIPNFEGHWISKLMTQDVSELLDKEQIGEWNQEYLNKMRASYHYLTDVDSDSIPTPEVYFSIGSISSMMTGKPVRFASGTGWFTEHIEDWNQLENVQFDPDNVWVHFHQMVAQDLINRWEGDFAMTPCIYRSPLDAANGLRGNDLFTDCYDEPEKVQALTMQCADWAIACEKYLHAVLKWPKGLHRGTWGIALPDGVVFVNGDPVDLVNAEHQALFDRPSSSKLFTHTGGGFFHHHALGLRQVENVAKTEGLVIQNIHTDPGIEKPFIQMLKDESIAQQVIRASLVAPIHLNGDFGPWLKQLYPILKKGCFILNDIGTSWTPEMEDMMAELRMP